VYNATGDDDDEDGDNDLSVAETLVAPLNGDPAIDDVVQATVAVLEGLQLQIVLC
jgi:hypothetical protein